MKKSTLLLLGLSAVGAYLYFKKGVTSEGMDYYAAQYSGQNSGAGGANATTAMTTTHPLNVVSDVNSFPARQIISTGARAAASNVNVYNSLATPGGVGAALGAPGTRPSFSRIDPTVSKTIEKANSLITGVTAHYVPGVGNVNY